ncbi:MAG: CvpA family protein [Clostridia bacterium]|nr:CvpA family protein [Clostridia bacterium]
MSVTTILDIVLGIVALMIIIKFTVKGFLRSVLDTLKVFAAAFIAYLIRMPVANLIDSWFMQEKIVNWVRTSLQETIAGADSFVNFKELYENVPEFFSVVLSKFGLGDVSNLGTLEQATSEQVEELSLSIGSSISMLLSTAIAVIVLFIVAIIVLSIVIKLLDGLMNFTAVRAINRILGFIMGVALAGGVIWLVSYGLGFLIDMTGSFGGKLTHEMLNESMLINLIKSITQMAK